MLLMFIVLKVLYICSYTQSLSLISYMFQEFHVFKQAEQLKLLLCYYLLSFLWGSLTEVPSNQLPPLIQSAFSLVFNVVLLESYCSKVKLLLLWSLIEDSFSIKIETNSKWRNGPCAETYCVRRFLFSHDDVRWHHCL